MSTTAHDDVRAWVEDGPYGAALGVKLDEVADDTVTIRLPFQTANSNPGDALHGGCAVSLGIIGSHAQAAAVLDPEVGPLHTTSCHVNYLAAAINEDVVATTRLLRRGKAMAFTDTLIETNAGKAIAQVSTMVRGRLGAEPIAGPTAAGDDGAAEPGPMAEFVQSAPFMAAREMNIVHMTNGYSRIEMPLGSSNGDLSGAVHEGAAMALLDTTGGMAAWAVTGPGRYKAATTSLAAQVIGDLRADELVAYGVCKHRDNETFWCEVEVADASTQAVHVRGTVVYRLAK